VPFGIASATAMTRKPGATTSYAAPKAGRCRALHRRPTLALLAVGALAPGIAGADEDPYGRARADHPDLFRVYYDEGVMEYCGLQTRNSMGGFFLQRDQLLESRPMSAADHRAVRIAASIAVDLEFDNRGLGGQRNWCRTAGLDAYGRFIATYWYGPGPLLARD